MTWTDPFTAITGTVIASGSWNAVRDDLRDLHAIMPYPTAGGYVHASTGATAGDWEKVDDDLADASAFSVNRLKAGGTASRVVKTNDGTNTVLDQVQSADLADASVVAAKIANGNVTTGKLAPGSVDDSKVSGVSGSKIAPGTAPLTALVPGTGNRILATNGTTGVVELVQVTNAMLAGLSVATGNLQDTSVTYAKVGAENSPSGNQFLGYDSATGNLQWATPTGTVPSGMIAGFQTAASIPAGWSRFTSADGRLFIGAGTTGSQTFTENTQQSSSWTHSHGISQSLAWSQSTGTISGSATGNTGGPTATSTAGGGSGSNVPTDTHAHNGLSLAVSGSATITGTVSGAASGTGSTTFIPPVYVGVYAQKA